jgi:hypothetical protein
VPHAPDVVPAVSDAPPQPTHSITTRSKAGVFKPNPKYAMAAAEPQLSPLPRSAREALRDPNWRAAMQAEYNALVANSTWSLVPRPPHARVITGK